MIHSFSMENKGHDSQFFNENHRSGLRDIYSSNFESYNKSVEEASAVGHALTMGVGKQLSARS